MEFRVLGPLAVERDGRPLPLGGPKQRAVLAVLLLAGDAGVTRDRLIDGVWGDRPPATAGHTLDNYLSRLRKLLGDGRIERRAHGYSIALQPGELDADRFETQLAAAGAATDPVAALEALRTALALWRGPALADLQFEPFAAAEVGRLEERRLQALEQRADAQLALGEGAGLVAELESLVHEHPFRERLVAALMLALYRSGRHADALEAHQEGRRRLAGELGLEPGPQLQELQRRILEHDSALLPVRRRAKEPRPRRALLMLAGVALVVAIALQATGDRGHAPAALAGDRLVALGADGRPAASVALAGAPAAMAAGFGSLWVALPGSGSVVRVDPGRRAIVDTVPVGGTPALLAVGDGAVWVASGLGDRLTRIDPRTGAVAQTLPLGAARAAALVFGAGRLWVADQAGDAVIEVDPATAQLRRTLPLGFHPGALALAGSVLWVADYAGASVTRVDLHTGRTTATVHVGGGAAALAVDGDAIWVANSLDSTVSRIDARTASVAQTVSVGSGPAALNPGGKSVAVASQYAAAVSQVSRSGTVRRVRTGTGAVAVAAVGARTWVAMRPTDSGRGGTLVLVHARPLNIDPALNVDILPLQSDALTRDGLLTYRRVPGAAGAQIVPDLAISLPQPVDAGRTYTFRLRPGIRYSDGRPLRAADFRRAIERTLRLDGDSAPAFTGIAGAAGCPRVCDLSRGIVGDEEARTVTFHLRAPDPDLPAALTLAAASAVPAGTSDRPAGANPISGTGPYRIVTASRRGVRWERNPFFHEWSHAAQPAGRPAAIVLRSGVAPPAIVREIAAGHADWSATNVPRARLPELRRRYGPRLHAFTIPTTDFGQFNTTRPPFDDIRARHALNLAIDRRQIAALYGGSALATPTCQILPPGIPGYRRHCPYPRPRLARARRLAAASGTRGQRVVVWAFSDDATITPAVSRYVAAAARRIGYRARVHLVAHDALDERAIPRIQLILAAWGDTPSGFFDAWFSCGAQANQRFFCDRRIEASMRRAQRLKATRPRAAAAIWARIDRDLTDRAAWLPMINEHGLDFVSDRVRGYQVHPYWGVIASQIRLG